MVRQRDIPPFRARLRLVHSRHASLLRVRSSVSGSGLGSRDVKGANARTQYARVERARRVYKPGVRAPVGCGRRWGDGTDGRFGGLIGFGSLSARRASRSITWTTETRPWLSRPCSCPPSRPLFDTVITPVLTTSSNAHTARSMRSTVARGPAPRATAHGFVTPDHTPTATRPTTHHGLPSARLFPGAACPVRIEREALEDQQAVEECHHALSAATRITAPTYQTQDDETQGTTDI